MRTEGPSPASGGVLDSPITMTSSSSVIITSSARKGGDGGGGGGGTGNGTLNGVLNGVLNGLPRLEAELWGLVTDDSRLRFTTERLSTLQTY